MTKNYAVLRLIFLLPLIICSSLMRANNTPGGSVLTSPVSKAAVFAAKSVARSGDNPPVLGTVHFVVDSNLNTGNNATIILTDSIADIALDSTDEIGVFTAAGVLCGAALFQGENLAITVWGDDTETPGLIEGMQAGETYHFKVWDASLQHECNARITFLSGNKTYEPDGFEVIQSLVFGVPTYSFSAASVCGSFTLNNQTYTESGTYIQVIPNAAGCDSTITLQLIIRPIPTVTITGDTICSGQSAVLTASGATYYVWLTGAEGNSITVSPNENTTYTVIGETEGCLSDPATAQVVVNFPPAINLGADTTISQGVLITLSAPAGTGYSYLWSTGATTSSIVVNAMGIYAVTVTSEAGCSASDAIVIMTTATNNPGAGYQISLSPNPVQDLLTVVCQGASTSGAQVTDNLGRVVVEDNAVISDGMPRIINLHKMPSGVYFLRIAGDGFAKTATVIKD